MRSESQSSGAVPQSLVELRAEGTSHDDLEEDPQLIVDKLLEAKPDLQRE